MNRTGVLYDVGRVMGVNWHPHFDPKVVHRERSILKNDLHCAAVKICGLDIPRLMLAAEEALALGREVWLSPFAAPLFPFHDHPRYDLDMANDSLVN